jgi:hypothetical protein
MCERLQRTEMCRDRVIIIGKLYKGQAGKIYSIYGLAPTLDACGGGIPYTLNR